MAINSTPEHRNIAAEARGEGSTWLDAIVHGKDVQSIDPPDFAERQWKKAIACMTGVGDDA